MQRPYITIDLAKIEHNARTLTTFCASHGVEVSGVTKSTCAIPQVAEAMLRGGVQSIGESRLENMTRLRSYGLQAPLLLLRLPHLSAVEDVVATAEISLNSEPTVLRALSQAAQKQGRRHDVILMVDLGDLREGLWPDKLMSCAQAVLDLPGVRLVGLGTNLSCYGGVVPTVENMSRLADYAAEIERRFDLKLRYVSGGNSSALNLLASGRMPKKINHLRLGESILLGRETVERAPWPQTFQDAFVLHAEIIELKKKPSVPIGETGQDAFGNRPVFEDKGDIYRAILNVGRQDVNIDGLTPVDPRVSVLGASSDHLLLDVSAAKNDLRVGAELSFQVDYSALLAVATSPYIEKKLMS